MAQNVTDGVTFPVYVLAKDCGEVMEFASMQGMWSYLEPIDVENGEYQFWDVNGQLLKLVISESRPNWLRLESTGKVECGQDFAVLKAKAKLQVR